MRWDPYVLESGVKAKHLLKQHFDTTASHHLLFVMGKGFDVRMNNVIRDIVSTNPNLNISCLLICFNEGSESSSHQYVDYVKKNYDDLTTILSGKSLIEKNINLWKQDGTRRRRVGDREAAALINSYDDLKGYSDIIIDISALPRGIYFSLVGKFIHILDSKPADAPLINLMVTVSENAKIDNCIKENDLDSEPKFLMGFMGGIKSPPEREEPLIWLPILGEDKEPHIRSAHSELAPNEVCPIFPFPAKDLRRPDSLLISYHSLLFDVLKIEPQNIMYVPEQNPFEAYKIIIKTVNNYYKSLGILNGCRAALSTFSSKLLSIGTLLAAYQTNIERDIIGVVNVDARGYTIENIDEQEEFNKQSELFVIWLIGVPYEG
ncbi:MAG: hypothetical protein JST82_13810 [Bacteroidetes bacterium]|nr:hypothetical protein [Bacteroidota bacterium]